MTSHWLRGVLLIGLVSLPVFSTGCELLPFTATVEVRNNSLAQVVEINISPSVSPGWGRNHLDSNLGRFDSKTFTVPAGVYDLRAIDEFGRIATEFDVRLRPDDHKIWELSEFKMEEVPEEMDEAYGDDKH